MTELNSLFAEAVNLRATEMVNRLSDWASINSGSNNQIGLERMLSRLQQDFGSLPATVELVDCTGKQDGATGTVFSRRALRVSRVVDHAASPVLLNGHYDTVFEADHSFQDVERVSEKQLRGPGVVDMKGGLVVMLTALSIWESSEYAGTLPWEVLITPDEETGSQASVPLLKDAAKLCRFGLIYESSNVDGAFVLKRKGSAVYTVVAAGRSAHVGKNYADGRNAILALAELSLKVQRLAEELGLICNVGSFEAKGPLNVVPDSATAAWNLRADTVDQLNAFEKEFSALCSDAPEGISFSLEGGVTRPPKVPDSESQEIYDAVAAIASSIGLPVSWRYTGGGSDGSNLVAYGLPNLDNLGVRGSGIHSSEETVELDSLVERVVLTLEILKAETASNFISTAK